MKTQRLTSGKVKSLHYRHIIALFLSSTFVKKETEFNKILSGHQPSKETNVSDTNHQIPDAWYTDGSGNVGFFRPFDMADDQRQYC
jgi:hypothetical protein